VKESNAFKKNINMVWESMSCEFIYEKCFNLTKCEHSYFSTE